MLFIPAGECLKNASGVDITCPKILPHTLVYAWSIFWLNAERHEDWDPAQDLIGVAVRVQLFGHNSLQLLVFKWKTLFHIPGPQAGRFGKISFRVLVSIEATEFWKELYEEPSEGHLLLPFIIFGAILAWMLEMPPWASVSKVIRIA